MSIPLGGPVRMVRAPGRTFGRRALRAAGAAFAVAGLVSCSSHSHSTPKATAESQAGIVALDYTKALFAGRFAAASRYVAPASRNSLLVITRGLRPGSLTTRNLAVGSTAVRGDRAVAILTGTLCSTHGTATVAAGRARLDCITNSDPHGDNPAFRVNLTRDHRAGRWRVTFAVQ